MELSILDRAFCMCVCVCVFACENDGRNFLDAPLVTALPELIKKTFQSIKLHWTRGALSGLPAPGAQKIVITPAEKRAARLQLGQWIRLKLSLRKREEDDEWRLWEKSRRCSCGGLRWYVSVNEKQVGGGKEK